MDLHLVFDRPAKLLKVFRVGDGAELFSCEARNDTIGSDTADPFGHFEPCPPGIGYGIRPPTPTNEVATGAFFFELLDDPAGDFLKHGRAAIGIHGGGTGLENPFAPRQGWIPTEGCIRLQNEDVAHLAQLVTQAIASNGHATLDVVDP